MEDEEEREASERGETDVNKLLRVRHAEQMKEAENMFECHRVCVNSCFSSR